VRLNTITLTILDEKLEQMKSCYSYRTFFYYMKVHGEDGHCSWYGECGPSPTGKYNCKYTGPAIPMTNQTGLKILKTYCPDLIDGE
jgi:hypothetical protein